MNVSLKCADNDKQCTVLAVRQAMPSCPPALHEVYRTSCPMTSQKTHSVWPSEARGSSQTMFLSSCSPYPTGKALPCDKTSSQHKSWGFGNNRGLGPKCQAKDPPLTEPTIGVQETQCSSLSGDKAFMLLVSFSLQ